VAGRSTASTPSPRRPFIPVSPPVAARISRSAPAMAASGLPGKGARKSADACDARTAVRGLNIIKKNATRDRCTTKKRRDGLARNPGTRSLGTGPASSTRRRSASVWRTPTGALHPVG